MVQRVSEARADLLKWSHTLEEKVMERTEALEKAHERMLMHEKMASLGKLSAMVAHEINNPLSGVLSYLKLTSKLLGREATPPANADKINQYLDLSANEIKRCGDIVKNLLMFSKQSFGEFKWDNLNLIIDKSIALIKHSADMKNVAILKELDAAGSDRLYCDSSGVQQMLVALMVNALDAMDGKGGHLTVRTHYQSPTEITVQVIDTGKGIPEEILPHIFEPFFSFKESKKSIGMGLSVVYGIVQSHQGTIQVRSKVGEGTTFTITLAREKTIEPAAAETTAEGTGN
jgi:two-component system NtrC family sensor kinase